MDSSKRLLSYRRIASLNLVLEKVVIERLHERGNDGGLME